MKDGMLEFKDAPMFGRVMRNEELCKQVLEVILNIEIDHIEYLNTEQEMSAYNDAKGVRLDVYLKASDKVFDIEMQTTDTPYGKRMRYYQSAIDSSLLNKGEDYTNLVESYIIFICTKDPFGHDIPLYTIERRCMETDIVDNFDDSHWLILNANAWAKDTDKARSELLQYIQNSKVGDSSLIQAISHEVDRNNSDSEWRQSVMGFMTYEMHYKGQISHAEQKGFARGLAEGEARGRAEGVAEGIAEGEARNRALIDKLLADNRLDDLKRSTTDEAFCSELYKEYGL